MIEMSFVEKVSVWMLTVMIVCLLTFFIFFITFLLNEVSPDVQQIMFFENDFRDSDSIENDYIAS